MPFIEVKEFPIVCPYCNGARFSKLETMGNGNRSLYWDRRRCRHCRMEFNKEKKDICPKCKRTMKDADTFYYCECGITVMK